MGTVSEMGLWVRKTASNFGILQHFGRRGNSVCAYMFFFFFFFPSTRDFFIGLYSLVRYPKIVFDLQFI